MGSMQFKRGVVNYSPYLLIVCILAVILGLTNSIMTYAETTYLILLGLALAPILILNYKTKKKYYAGVYGLILGGGASLILLGTQTSEEHIMMLLHMLGSIFLGEFIVLALFRKRLNEQILTNEYASKKAL